MSQLWAAYWSARATYGSRTLEFTRAEFAAWLEGCKAGEFDDLGV
ncbi:hypothetical protein [Nocardia pneumoniae]|nr:hypothetical protein [Nocardia pneumoniae]